MGSWGVGIREDDFVLDVEGTFEDHLKDGKTMPEATKTVLEQFADAIDDCEDGPLLWFAIADIQWKYGDLDPEVLGRVMEIVDTDGGMGRWGKPSDKLYKQRKAAVVKFRNKVSAPNRKPSPFPRRVIRKPKFKAGDCLSIKLENGKYGAALVLKTDHSSPEHGMDLVGELTYMADTPPALNVFVGRRWLTLEHLNEDCKYHISWYHYMGFRKMKPRITVIGSVPIYDTDPKDSSTFFTWHLLGKHVQLQREWEAGQKKLL